MQDQRRQQAHRLAATLGGAEENADRWRVGARMDVAHGDRAEGRPKMREAFAELVGAMDQGQPALWFQEIGAGANPALEPAFVHVMRGRTALDRRAPRPRLLEERRV